MSPTSLSSGRTLLLNTCLRSPVWVPSVTHNHRAYNSCIFYRWHALVILLSVPIIWRAGHFGCDEELLIDPIRSTMRDCLLPSNRSINRPAAMLDGNISRHWLNSLTILRSSLLSPFRFTFVPQLLPNIIDTTYASKAHVFTVFFQNLTAHNWQKWKSWFRTCPCHKIYRVEAVVLSLFQLLYLKITIYVKFWAILWKVDSLLITA